MQSASVSKGVQSVRCWLLVEQWFMCSKSTPNHHRMRSLFLPHSMRELPVRLLSRRQHMHEGCADCQLSVLRRCSIQKHMHPMLSRFLSAKWSMHTKSDFEGDLSVQYCIQLIRYLHDMQLRIQSDNRLTSLSGPDS